MLRTIEQKNNFVDDLWKNYTNELDKELQSKCLELFGNYNDFCIFGINVGNNSGIYLIPFEHSTLALLRDEAGAFWGVSYSGGKSFEIRESQKNDIDRFILEKTGLPFFKFRSSDDKTFSELNEKLALYLRVKLKRKKSIFSHEVSLDELLSRFNDALALGDANTAGVYLQHIEKRSEIFLINKIFLAIKYYYLLKDWGSIVNHKDLLDLKDIRRPRLITEYILMAIYNTRIRPVISNSDEAIQVFNEQVAPLFSSLMLYSDDYKAKEVYILLALDSVRKSKLYKDEGQLQKKSRTDNHEIELIENKLKEINDSDIPIAQYVELINSIRNPREPNPDLLKELLKLVDEERYLDLINLLEKNKNLLGVDHLRIVLGILSEFDVSTVRRVHKLYSELDEHLKASLLALPRLKRVLDNIDEVILKEAITLDTWLNMVISGEDESSIRTAFGKLTETLDSQAVTQNTVNLLERSFAKNNNAWTEEIKSVVPYILKVLGELDSDLVSTHWKMELFRFICESPRLQSRDRQLVQDVLSLVLEDGLTSDEYNNVVLYVSLVWDKLKSPKNILWPLEILEEIYSNPIQNQSEVNDFAKTYIEDLYINKNSLDGSDISLLESFFADKKEVSLQLTGLLEETTIDQRKRSSIEALASFLNYLKIGIYSLEETAAKGARNYLLKLNTSAEIGLNHDKKCTDALESLYKRSDVFVFAAKAAKHAAFKCIPHQDLIYPAGKGSSSIINAIFAYLKSDRATTMA